MKSAKGRGLISLQEAAELHAGAPDSATAKGAVRHSFSSDVAERARDKASPYR